MIVTLIAYAVQLPILNPANLELVIGGLHSKSLTVFYKDAEGFKHENRFTALVGPALVRDQPGATIRIPLPPSTDELRLQFTPPGKLVRIETYRLFTTKTGLLFNQRSEYDFSSAVTKMTDLAVVEHSIIRIPPDSKKPRLELSLTQAQTIETRTEFHGAGLAVLALLAMILWSIPHRSSRSPRETSITHIFLLQLVAAILLLTTLASILPFRHGPDEYLHFFSGAWYLTHIRPPSFADPQYISEYWGTNYILGTRDLGYFITSRLALILSHWTSIPDILSMRYAQLLTLALALMTLLRLGGTRAALAALITLLLLPQVWYLFTYYNGDASSLALALFALILVAHGSGRSHTPVFFLALAILLNLKTNYLVLLPTIMALHLNAQGKSILRMRDWRDAGALMLADLKQPLIAGAALCAMALGGFRPLFNLYDRLSNGTNLLDFVCQNPQAMTCINLLAARNEGLDWSVLGDANWYLHSFQSAFAVFGKMSEASEATIIAAALLLTVWSLLLLAAANWTLRVTLLATVALNIAASLYFSASYDYQPQGRYLFPSLVLAATIAGLVKQRLHAFWLYAPVVALPALIAFTRTANP